MKTLFALLLGVGALAQTVSAESVSCPCTFRQNWPWDARLLIDVEMPAGTNDLALTASFVHDGERVELELSPGTGLSGASLFCRTNGLWRYVWDPGAAGYPKALSDFALAAEAVPPADRTWLVVDMATGSAQYCADDAAPRNEAGRPWQETVYMTDKMVFRRIPAGTFTMGYTDEQIAYLTALSPAQKTLLKARRVELTSDFYLAIYPTTRGQIRRLQNRDATSSDAIAWTGDKNVTGGGATCFQRGSNAVEGVSWPTTKFRVTTDSWVAQFRARCGNRFMIDLPTAAQWQRAMRPDANWIWYDTPEYGGGAVGDSATTLTNVLDVISQIPERIASGKNFYSTPWRVGLKQPNALGFYDSVGARPELVLDQWNGTLDDFARDAVDPVGPATNPRTHIMFSAFVNDQSLAAWSLCNVQGMSNDHDLNADTEICFRYAIHLNPPVGFNGTWE